ncbi:MAG: 2-phosphosulfolactate phosphatase [Candidatus Tectomicrobia bacterium]|nr:2-phosphosulfolactate phosphatase [Candidatus Tectomicrobia bacterium]
MDIDVTFTPLELSHLSLEGKTVIVIDVLRATSTIVQAITNSCERVITVDTIDQAKATLHTLKSGRVILGGERGGKKIEGFDLGNSPGEYTVDIVAGATIVMTTTNGTITINACHGARQVLIGSFLNLPAVVCHLIQSRYDSVVFAASGKGNRPTLDDTVCAGMMVQHILEHCQEAKLSDSSQIARSLYLHYQGRIIEALKESASGRALIKIGYEADIEHCAVVGALQVIPLVSKEGILPSRFPLDHRSLSLK